MLKDGGIEGVDGVSLGFDWFFDAITHFIILIMEPTEFKFKSRRVKTQPEEEFIDTRSEAVKRLSKARKFVIPPEPTYEPYNQLLPPSRLLLPSDDSLSASIEQYATPIKNGNEHLKFTPKFTPIAPDKLNHCVNSSSVRPSRVVAEPKHSSGESLQNSINEHIRAIQEDEARY